ncbi:MAG: hypothetical protein Q8L10_04205 [Candidatus Moranbacteria bacterium]|nr:hypothetical protein [Candidatus Moranbacteria bacterium]
MINEDKNNLISKPWARISSEWKKTVTPPMSPSPDDLKIYKKWIDKKCKKEENLNVLVLGSTVEIRELLNGYDKLNITVCDINKNHYLAMSKLMKSINNKEFFIESEWSVAPLKKEFFDIIIGDGIIANVEHKNKIKFMLNMVETLKHDGIMVIREAYIREERLVGIDEMLLLFSNYKINTWSPMELLFSLEWAIYNRKTRKISFLKIARHLRRKYYDNKAKKFVYPPSKEVEKLLNHPTILKWLEIKKEWDVFNYPETKKLIEKYFKIIAKEHGQDHLTLPTCKIFGDVMPIWVLARKN